MRVWLVLTLATVSQSKNSCAGAGERSGEAERAAAGQTAREKLSGWGNGAGRALPLPPSPQHNHLLPSLPLACSVTLGQRAPAGSHTSSLSSAWLWKPPKESCRSSGVSRSSVSEVPARQSRGAGAHTCHALVVPLAPTSIQAIALYLCLLCAGQCQACRSMPSLCIAPLQSWPASDSHPGTRAASHPHSAHTHRPRPPLCWQSSLAALTQCPPSRASSAATRPPPQSSSPAPACRSAQRSAERSRSPLSASSHPHSRTIH